MSGSAREPGPAHPLVSLGLVPGLTAVVVAAAWMAHNHLSSGWWVSACNVVMAVVALAALGSVRDGYEALCIALAHWPGWSAQPLVLLTCALALVSAVATAVVLVSGPTVWAWLVVAGPVSAGIVSSLGAATSPGPGQRPVSP